MLMQPDQYPTIPPPAGPPPSPFDFILNNGSKSKKTSFSGGGSGMKQRILIAAGGAIVLVILAAVFFSVTSKSGKAAIQTLVTIGAEQTELVRVADLSTDKLRYTSSKNLAATTSVSTRTNLQLVIGLIKRRGYKLTLKELDVKKNPATDQKLVVGEQNNRYDETFDAIMLDSLNAYRSSLKEAYDAADSAKEKQTLSDMYKGVSLIIDNQVAQK